MATSSMLTSASMRLAQAVSRYLASAHTPESQQQLTAARDRFNSACSGSPGTGYDKKPFRPVFKPGKA